MALDELGRGTATLDGAAIASAVLSHMAGTTACRGLFATHYHHLSTEHAADPRCAIMHMACAVGGRTGDEEEAAQGAMEVEGVGKEEVEEVTFLYKLTQGKSWYSLLANDAVCFPAALAWVVLGTPACC